MREHMKVAILSNINLGSVTKLVGKKHEIMETVGYGNLLELLINQDSDYHKFCAQICVLIVDIWDIIKDTGDKNEAKVCIDEWFMQLERALDTRISYFISDVDTRGGILEIAAYGQNEAVEIENYWHQKRQGLLKRQNIFGYEYKKLVENIGKKQFYSSKLWYLGKIPYTNIAQKLIAEEILKELERYEIPRKKVLLLDLDCTLWGGVIGEEGIDGIQLSDDGIGAIYKDFQRVIKRLKTVGVILGIVSKNNEADALEVLEQHSHMLLRKEDFVSYKINWEAKYKNILEIAKELNVGTDSIVFIDDNPTEREEVKAFLSDVVVPDFPDKIEDLSSFAVKVYEHYFKPLKLTGEDKIKTEQYKANEKRAMAKNAAASFEDFLEDLGIEVEMYLNETSHLTRIHQLLGKTNQFNLTTKRYNIQEVEDMLESSKWDIFSFKVKDRFGDYGIVGVVIIDKREKEPVIDSFLMSCRVMSKYVENYILDQVEKQLASEGYSMLRAFYYETVKNKPVKDFYTNHGYKKVKENVYEIDLNHKPVRNYRIKVKK